MVSMEKSQESMKDCAPVSCEHEKYPYGLRIHLDHESMKKLGIKELPKVGDKVMVQAMAIVCDVSDHMMEGKEESRKSMGLQICEMACGSKSDKKKASDELYEEGE